MKQFLTVLRFELDNYFKNKTFLVTTIGLAILAAAVIIVPTLIPGFLKSSSKESGTQTESETSQELLGIYPGDADMELLDGVLKSLTGQWETFDDQEALKKAVKEEKIQAGFILEGANARYVVNNLQISDNRAREFQEVYADYMQQRYYLDKGLTQAELAEAAAIAVHVEPVILGKNSSGNYLYTYILIFAIYFLILFYGQMIAVSVTNEKSNRAIEILVTSVNPNSLICGKVLAGAIAGVVQMGIILGAAFGTYALFGDAWGGQLDFLLHIPGKVMGAFIIFEMLSYLLYAFIYGMLGAMVSKTEDISKSSSTITILYVISFMVAMFGMIQDSDSMMMKVASFIPFTSGNAMFIRVSMGTVASWEVILSFALLLGSCVAVGILAAKMFRFGTLRYGNPIKLRNALKSMRQ